jgi:hypothetical protein
LLRRADAGWQDDVKIWTGAEIEPVIGECTAGLARLELLVRTTSGKPAADVVGWGQYLDDEHRTGQQWGLYGTAAAVQILALLTRAAGNLAADNPLIAGALRLLPEDPDQGHELLEQKRAQHDFANVLKLAAIAEALRPDAGQIPADLEPAIVRRLRDLALAEGGWTTRPEGTAEREVRERDLATAYILHAWRRYDLGDVGLEARRWLARRVTDGEPIKGLDLLALVGLALTAHPLHPNDPQVVQQAIERADSRLVAWAREQADIRIDRPMFNGFSVGTTTDYLFLHPEILAALYFVRRGDPGPTRAFVLSVARAVAENIERNRGLMVSNGVIATVDQLWATRFLLELRILHQDHGLVAVAPPVDASEVRQRARANWRTSLTHAREAVRLWASKEAGYRKLVAKGLLVLAPIALAVVAAVLLFAHPAEGIASVIIGVLLAISGGYYFFFKSSDPP